jgi:hypothetical protein
VIVYPVNPADVAVNWVGPMRLPLEAMKQTGDDIMLLGVEVIVQVPASNVGWNNGYAYGTPVVPGGTDNV